MTEYTINQAKEVVLKQLRLGNSVAGSLQTVDRSQKTWEYWRKSDAEFKRRADEIRTQLREAGTQTDDEVGTGHPGQSLRKVVPDFPDFCERYLGVQLFRHQLQWIDLIEGREPRDLHSSQVYEQGWMKRKKLYLVNTPPDHAKTQTLSISYATYRILKDPNIRILIISKTQDLAKDILGAIQQRLNKDNPLFEDLKRDFAPAEGFNSKSAEWRADRFRLNADIVTSGEKDPTCQAKGLATQIYGKRADLVIMDDCVDTANAHDFEKHIKWIQNEVISRIVAGGVLLICGTRLATQDLYSEIRRADRYPAGSSPFTYLSQPAVLEYGDNPHDWVTLWPKSNKPPENAEYLDEEVVADENGLFDRFTGESMAEIRGSMDARNWAMVYMQQQVQEASTFTLEDINGCTGVRFPGAMRSGVRGHRPEGMAGLYVVAGLDPAAANYTAAVVLGVDRNSGRRYVLDVHNQHHMLPSELNALVRQWTVQYGVMEWRIEINSYQQSIVQDEDLLQFCRSRGTRVDGHTTGRNKWDSMYGVASMAYLFKGWDLDANMIELPNRQHHRGVQTLVEQLITWYPTPNQTRAPIQDTVMALWFAEIRAREIVNEAENWDHWESKPYWSTERRRENTMSVDIDMYLASQNNQGFL